MSCAVQLLSAPAAMLASPSLQGSDAETLQLPAVNGFLRRLQYQHLHGRGSASTSGFVVEVPTYYMYAA